MSKYAVLSDIHAHRSALESVLDDIGDVQGIWFLGDLFDRGNEPAWVYNVLKSQTYAENIWLVGNHDLAIAYLTDTEKYLSYDLLYKSLSPKFQESCEKQISLMPRSYINSVAGWPTQMNIRVNKLPIFLVHGFPSVDMIDSLVQCAHEVAPLNGHHINLENISQQVTGGARIWLVGHTHRQVAWLYGGRETGWSEWQSGFGDTLTGVERHTVPSDDKPTTLAEAYLDFDQLADDALLILNPGSVAFGRDSYDKSGKSWAKYLLLEIDEMNVLARFRAVPFRSEGHKE